MIARSDSDPAVSTGDSISPEAIISELHLVAASAAFGKAERPARFLRHLVETALRGENSILKESILGMDVFGRPATWDPRLDPIVRQEAARLRKRLAAYYQNGGANDDVRIELPVGSYVPLFRRKPAEAESAAVVDEPPLSAVPISAVLIPTGSVPLGARTEEPAAMPSRRVWPYAAAGIVCIVLAITFWRVAHRGEAQASIVVLPFANLTVDSANLYFSDALTDEITDSLTRIHPLRVIARESALPFKGKAVDIREVGRKLNVSTVLEGSVERSADRIKITSRLENGADGSLLWSKTYEGNVADLYALQSELAAAIAGRLGVDSGARSAKHIPSAGAYEWTLKARYDAQQVTPESMRKAELEFQHAIDLDPEYGTAYLGLGCARYDESAARGSVYQTEAERRSAEQLLHKALDLDPELPTAHGMLAALAMHGWDWAGAERELRLASAGPSSASAESYYVFYLIFNGRFAEAEQHVRRMLDIDPFSTVTMNNLALARCLEGRFAEAREVAQRMAAQFPKMLAPPELIGLTYIEEGKPELALPIFRQVEARFPQIQVFEAMAYARAGQRDLAMRLLRPYEEKYPNPGVPMQWFALAYSQLHDAAGTAKWMERSVERHEWQALNLAVNPAFASMRHSPEFETLKRRIGLSH